MSEYLLESSQGGSIANVAYNPCGVTSTSQMLFKEFLNTLFGGERSVGRAVFAAKCSIIARYPGDDTKYGPAVLWTLFGDPALRVRHRILTDVEESPKPQARSQKLRVSPNPCRRSGVLRLTTGPLDHSTTLTIYNASGLLQLSHPVRSSSFVISTSSFPSGVYVVELRTTGYTLTRKLVVR